LADRARIHRQLTHPFTFSALAGDRRRRISSAVPLITRTLSFALLLLFFQPGLSLAEPDQGHRDMPEARKSNSKVHSGVARRVASSQVPIQPVESPEARLIAIYQMIGQSQTRQALALAEQLVHDQPDFALAQLVLGDLLLAQTAALPHFGNAPASTGLDDLRRQSQLRLTALRERPPPGSLPSNFVRLSRHNKHAIAIDGSRARLYLFQNHEQGPRLIADYYISVGKLGLDKSREGDLRTPLGVYFISSRLDPKTLTPYYGSGALPLSYPNVLDLRRGKTGRGIWLHGTPPGQYARAPQASDGCVVLANADLTKIIQTVEVRSTPVVIARQLDWVMPAQQQTLKVGFEQQLQAWLATRTQGSEHALTRFYAPDFESAGKKLPQWLTLLRQHDAQGSQQGLYYKDLSLLYWKDSDEILIATFGELRHGQRTGVTRRQYWRLHNGNWTIFFEGVNR